MNTFEEKTKRERDFLLEVIRRISAADTKNEKFTILVIQEAKEAVSFVEENLI